MGASDELQDELREALIARGEFHLSSASIGGERYLRAVMMSPATGEATLRRLLDTLERLAPAVSAPQPVS